MADIRCNSCGVVVCETNNERWRFDRMTNPLMMKIKSMYGEHQMVEWPPDEGCILDALECPVCSSQMAPGSTGVVALVSETITAQDLMEWAQVVHQHGSASMSDAIQYLAEQLIMKDILPQDQVLRLLSRATELWQDAVDKASGKITPEQRIFQCWCGKYITGQSKYAQHLAAHKRKGEHKPGHAQDGGPPADPDPDSDSVVAA
jgi:hypothetical protein